MLSTIYDQLNTNMPIIQRKTILSNYLHKQAKLARATTNNREVIAYELAGLLSTKLASQLPNKSLLMQILYLAGELELPEEERSKDATWERFFYLVKKL